MPDSAALLDGADSKMGFVIRQAERAGNCGTTSAQYRGRMVSQYYWYSQDDVLEC
jgi:hypothetical protein